MNKRLAIFISMLTCLLLVGCSVTDNGSAEDTAYVYESVEEAIPTVQTGQVSKEEKGVPEALVLGSDAYALFTDYYQVDNYSITHNVDLDLHTDAVTFTMTDETEYAMITGTYIICYQYYKSDDVWVMTSINEGEYVTSLIEERFTTDSGWDGRHENSDFGGNNEFYYTIYIKDIDFENATITMIYDLTFTNHNYDNLTQSTPVTLDLDPFGGAYIVRIDVEGKNTPYLDSINFLMDKDGLREFLN